MYYVSRKLNCPKWTQTLDLGLEQKMTKFLFFNTIKKKKHEDNYKVGYILITSQRSILKTSVYNNKYQMVASNPSINYISSHYGIAVFPALL